MATRTKTQLATAVLQHLGVAGAEGNVSATDAAYVSARYEDLWEEMNDDNAMAYWDRDEIPSVVFEALTHLVAISVASAFGFQSNVREIDEEMRVCKRRIRRHTQVKGAELPSPFEDF